MIYSEEYLDPDVAYEDASHIKVESSDDDPEVITYKCLICNRNFLHEKKRMQHLKQDHTKSELQCSICGGAFRSAVSLNDHLYLHKNPKLFEHFKQNYEKDKAPAKVPKSSKCHVKAKTIQQPTMTRVIVSSQNHKCFICGDQFLTKSHKKRHLQVEHGEMSLTCTICGAVKRTINGLDDHLECHENPSLLRHMCHYCSKLFRRACRLNEHVKIVHGSDMVKHKFSCDLCRFKAPFKVSMKNHIERVHLKILPFACPECPDRLFSNKSALLYHQGLQHGMATDHQCSLCTRYFPTKSHLKNHRINCNGVYTTSKREFFF
jgi:DNA-directed RNA polymerase subunit RPC12/RpoP